MIEPLYILSGACVGAIVGLTGVGGGSLMTPALMLLFGVAPATAVGTDLLYATTTKSVGALVHHRHGMVDWRIVGRLSAGSLPGAIVAMLAFYASAAEPAKLAKAISLTLGVALLLTATSLMFRDRLLLLARRHRGELSRRTRAWLTVLVGFVIGVLVAISSVGAGAVGVVALYLLYPRLPTARIIGADIAHAVPLTLVSGLGHLMMGSVDWRLLLSLLIGSIPGIAIGSALAPRLPERLLRGLLASVLIIVGGRLLFG